MTAGRLQPGTRLGPYEVVAQIGSGGMGHVYRGRDVRLGREVAIKVLAESAAADPQALQRFQQEAQAASALNHPNIVTVYDVGSCDDVPFIVTELLEGETLREAIERRHLSTAQTLAYVGQAAMGLAAAHSKGIVHRDIKPENLYITRTGVLKILDFGLSKLTDRSSVSGQPLMSGTAPGLLLGTAGYVSPEQIRQHPIDHRTDIFSLGVVLYEALAGQPPFRGESSAATLSAILTEEPPAVSKFRPGLTAVIDEVVRACLEKDPLHRFDSASDVALTLRAVERGARAWWLRVPAWRMQLAIIALAGVAGVALAVALALADSAATVTPSYQRVTFARGTITSARFRNDSNEVVYDAMLNGRPRELFATVPGTAEARSLGIGGAELLSVSTSGNLALSLDRRIVRGYVGTGMLAVMTEGQVPRELLADVHWADWAPDATSLVIVREVRGRTRLEFPIGTVLFETSGWISDPRFSPDGTRIAFVHHPVNADDSGRVMVTVPGGTPRTLAGDWLSVLGLAWNPSGEDVWFTAQDAHGVRALRAVDLHGRDRVVTQAPGRLRLLDISRDGRVLLARDDLRLEVHGKGPNDADESNLSWLDWSLARDISNDGTQVLLNEFGEAAGSEPGIYMRPIDGSSPSRLGTGSAMALSPDGQQVLSVWNGRLSLLPVGAGQITTLPDHGIGYHPWAGFFPGGRRIVFTGAERGRATRVYAQDLPDGQPTPITPEGFRLASPAAVSPDGAVIVIGEDETLFIVSPPGSAPRPLAGTEPGEILARWDRTGRAVFVLKPWPIPARVFRLSMDGRRDLLTALGPDDVGGAITIHRLVMTAGADAYAYTLERQISDLYVATGFAKRTMFQSLFSTAEQDMPPIGR